MERDLLPVSLLKYDLFIFDLDNTLYNEQEYLFSAYDEIASKLNGGQQKKEISAFLKTTFAQSGRQYLFDKLIEKFGLDKSAMQICLDILRSHKPDEKFMVLNSRKHLLEELKKKDKKLVLLTNGNVEQQKNKIANIAPNLVEIFEHIIYANSIEPKPSAKSVFHILELTGATKEQTLMIGDSKSDAEAAANAGVDYIDVSELDQYTRPLWSGD